MDYLEYRSQRRRYTSFSCHTTWVEQEHPGDDVEEGGRLPNALPDEDVGAPLPRQPAGQLWVTPYNFLVHVNLL